MAAGDSFWFAAKPNAADPQGRYSSHVLEPGDDEHWLQIDVGKWREMGEPAEVRVTVTVLEPAAEEWTEEP